MGKRVPEKNCCITVNLFHDGVLTVRLFEYAVSDVKQITDIQFEEHSGYDVLDIRVQGDTMADDGNESSDAYCSSDEEDLSYVDFYSEVDDNVVINTVSTNDSFLNKLCGDNVEFINLVDEPVNANVETVEEDTKNKDHVFNVNEGISYVTHDPNQDWKKMEPILGMRFHHPEKLKLCLANYRVANGYPLWFYRGGFGGRGEGTATMGESSATIGATRRSQRGKGRAVTLSADKRKQHAEPSEQPELQPQAIKKGSKRKAPTSSEEAPAKQRIIFHKNRGRSERMFNQKMKKFGFGKDEEGSTPDKSLFIDLDLGRLFLFAL
nr:hypothetical protein [Tanacetum cinerariifolium]